MIWCRQRKSTVFVKGARRRNVAWHSNSFYRFSPKLFFNPPPLSCTRPHPHPRQQLHDHTTTSRVEMSATNEESFLSAPLSRGVGEWQVEQHDGEEQEEDADDFEDDNYSASSTISDYNSTVAYRIDMRPPIRLGGISVGLYALRMARGISLMMVVICKSRKFHGIAKRLEWKNGKQVLMQKEKHLWCLFSDNFLFFGCTHNGFAHCFHQAASSGLEVSLGPGRLPRTTSFVCNPSCS